MKLGDVRQWTDAPLAAVVISGIGLALAGLSLWYLIIIRALYLGEAVELGGFALALRVIEVILLASFSLVLVYGGYWLVSSPFEADRLWWAGLWTMLGLAGVVALVALVTAFRVLQGQPIFRPSLVQEMLFAAGGGALGGFLIGLSTVRETKEGERAKRQRDTLVFVNQLLRHHLLNGMQLIQGNTDMLRDHVDAEGQQYLDSTDQQTERIVDLIQNVRALTQSISRDVPLTAICLRTVLQKEIDHAANAYPEATFTAATIPDVEVHADELLNVAFENVLSNAVNHNDTDAPQVTVTVEEDADSVAVRIADNGPGIPDEDRDRLIEPGESSPDSVGQGLGLYLVATLVDRYGGDISIQANEPRGTVVEITLPYAA